ncbi:hypothetical protein FQZ97_813980 [compost metagenome]
MTAATTDNTALSRNTQALPALAISAPASSGPMMREAFIDTPLSASAAGNWFRGTIVGTMAENTGQRIAMPMPLTNVSASSRAGVIAPRKMKALRIDATTATHSWVKRKKCLRFRPSASAPLGRPRRNTGKVDAVCTSATHSGVVVSEVIIQAAATSLIHMHTLAMSQVIHNMRKSGWRSGAMGDRSSSERGIGALM